MSFCLAELPLIPHRICLVHQHSLSYRLLPRVARAAWRQHKGVRRQQKQAKNTTARCRTRNINMTGNTVFRKRHEQNIQNGSVRPLMCLFPIAPLTFFVCVVMNHLGYDFCEDRWKLTEGLFLRWRCWAILPRPFQITPEYIYFFGGFDFPANWAWLGSEKDPKGKYTSFKIQ